MGRFSRLRKNKKYSYNPRYYDDKGEGSPYKMEGKLDKFRTVGMQRGLKAKFSHAMADLKKQGIRLLSEKSKIGAHGKPVVFVHPKGLFSTPCSPVFYFFLFL